MAPSALEGLNQSPPDLGIFDIKMPRMDGMELLNRIRKTQQFPVIFLTSKDEEIDEVLGLRMGADDFIRKPFSQRLLLERIRAVLRRADAGTAKGETAAERIVRGELILDPSRHQCTWKGKEGAPHGHRVPAVEVARRAAGSREEPRPADGCGLRRDDLRRRPHASTATSSACAASSARSTASSSRSKRFMASDIDTATPEPGRRFGLQGLRARIAAALGHRDELPLRAASAETPSLLRRRRSATRRYSPLTRRILLLNIIPVALLTLGAVYLSDYEEELD